MGRPLIFLKDWCLEDSMLKAEFLKRESENPNGLILRENQTYIPNLYKFPQFQSGNSALGQLSNGIQIQITQICYEKLKAKFRSFKKKLKDKDKVNKHYLLNRQTANYINKLKEDFTLHREEDVIENLIKDRINDNAQLKHFEKLERSPLNLLKLKNELSYYKKLCEQAETDKSQFYIRIDELEDLLARAYLLNEFLKDTLQDHNIAFHHPSINDEIVKKYKFEIRNNLRTYLQ